MPRWHCGQFTTIRHLPAFPPSQFRDYRRVNAPAFQVRTHTQQRADGFHLGFELHNCPVIKVAVMVVCDDKQVNGRQVGDLVCIRSGKRLAEKRNRRGTAAENRIKQEECPNQTITGLSADKARKSVLIDGSGLGGTVLADLLRKSFIILKNDAFFRVTSVGCRFWNAPLR